MQSSSKKQPVPYSDGTFPEIGVLMVSKMVMDEQIPPRFIYREKRTRAEDSGWRIFTGFESEAYNDNPDNIGLYAPTTILAIDPSLAPLLLKGVGSVYEKSADGTVWNAVTDFKLEDDYMVTHRLTSEWTLAINNLFERSVEETGDLLYTTGDKSVRLVIWNEEGKSKALLYQEYQQIIQQREQSVSPTLNTFERSDAAVLRTGYLIQETDAEKSYYLLYTFSIIDGEVLQAAFYFDAADELDWALETWEGITVV